MSKPPPPDTHSGGRWLSATLIAIGLAHVVAARWASTPHPLSRADSSGIADGNLLWVSPLLGIALAISWIAPGFLMLLPGSRRSFPATVLLAAPVAMLFHVAIASGVKWLGGLPAERWAVLGTQLAIEIVLAVRAVRAFRSGRGVTWGRDDRVAAWSFVLLCGAAALLFEREIFLRELTSDGVESLDMGASLGWYHLPRSPTASGLVGLGVGMIAQAFPAYWCTTIGGFTESAPRLPLVIFLPVVLMGVVAIAERGLPRRFSILALAASSVAILCGAAMLGMNASFDPYHADVSSPAALDAMTVAMMLGVVYAVTERRFGWLLLCAGFAHFCRPSGLLLLLVLAIATFLVDRGSRMRRSLPIAATAIFCVALTVLYEQVYAKSVIESGTVGLESASLFGRLRYVNVTDWQRLVIVLFASGIFPWFALMRPRRLDADARLVALATLGMFLFFLIPASYAPHHFAPVFVLIQVPFWRAWLAINPPRWMAPVALVVALGALAAIFPTGDVPEPIRNHAHEFVVRGDIVRPVERNLARDLLREAALLESVVALPWSDVDPTRQLVGSPLALALYAERSSRWLLTAPAFAIGPSTSPIDGYEPIATKEGLTLSANARGRALLPLAGAPTGFGRALFRVPRGRLFAPLMVRTKTYDFDLARLLGR